MRLREAGNPNDQHLVEEVATLARPFRSVLGLQPLVKNLSRRRIVMLGEASHGTHEYYYWRRMISEELISRHGFRFIAVEGDWPPCWAVNEHVHGTASGSRAALSHFRRWPTWMWANQETEELADWLQAYNSGAPVSRRAGFYGLDVYSLFESIDTILAVLAKESPFLARRLKNRYACFDPFQRDERAYARHLLEIPEGCRDAVVKNLQDLLELNLSRPSPSSPAGDPFFDAEQNARIVANSENYYRFSTALPACDQIL